MTTTQNPITDNERQTLRRITLAFQEPGLAAEAAGLGMLSAEVALRALDAELNGPWWRISNTRQFVFIIAIAVCFIFTLLAALSL